MLGPNVGERGEDYCRLREAGPGSTLDVLGAGHKVERFTDGKSSFLQLLGGFFAAHC